MCVNTWCFSHSWRHACIILILKSGKDCTTANVYLAIQATQCLFNGNNDLGALRGINFSAGMRSRGRAVPTPGSWSTPDSDSDSKPDTKYKINNTLIVERASAVQARLACTRREQSAVFFSLRSTTLSFETPGGSHPPPPSTGEGGEIQKTGEGWNSSNYPLPF